MNIRNFRIIFFEYLLVTFLAICTFKILITMHWPNTEAIIDSAKNITLYKAQWYAFQNRLMGPYIIQFISTFTVSFKFAWLVFNAVTLQIFCTLFFWIMKREGIGRRDSFTYLIYLLFAFLALQHYWLYAWDSIDLIIFTLFSYGILKKFPIRFFVIIFSFGILNRESALFIGVYLMLNALEFTGNRIVIKITNYKSLIVGGVLLIIGIAYTKFLRQVLFLSKPNGMPDAENELIGNHVNFLENLKALFLFNFQNKDFVVSIFIFSVISYFYYNYKEMNDSQYKLFLMLIVILFNIIIFGAINETRMYFILIPFIFFLALSLNRNKKD